MGRVAPAALTLLLGLAPTGCVYPECETVDHTLEILPFQSDPSVPAALEACSPDGVCVGAGGQVVFLPERIEENAGTQDLHGVATGWWGPSRWFVVGDAGTVLSTAPAETWTAHPVDTDADLRAVATRQHEEVVVATGDGVAVASRDGGQTWSVTDLPDGISIETLIRQPDDQLLGGSTDGRLFLTPDGESWAEVSSPTQQPVMALHTARGRVLLADGAGEIYERDEDGVWFLRPAPGTAPIRSFTGDLLVWALRDDGELIRRFEDGPWKEVDHTASDAAVLTAAVYTGVYEDDLGHDLTWVQSMCVLETDGDVDSTEAWLVPVRECVL